MFPFPLVKSLIKSNRRLYEFLSKIRYTNRYVFIFVSKLCNSQVDIDSMFKMVEIEICPLCNRKCSFCPVSQDNTPKKLMTNQLFDKILRELKELNFNGDICLNNYGEPLLDERLTGFVKRIKAKLGSKIIINTNGDFLTVDKFRELISAGIDIINVSQHDKKPSAAIKNLFSKVSSIELNHLAFAEVNEDSPLSNRGGTVKVKNLRYFDCSIQNIYIKTDGNIGFCDQEYYIEVKLGNVNQSKLIDIWDSPYYRKIRDEIKRGIFNLEICKKCLGIKEKKKFPTISGIKGWLKIVKTKFLVLLKLIKFRCPFKFIKIKVIDLLTFALFYPLVRILLGYKKGSDICNNFVGIFCPSAILSISRFLKSKIILPQGILSYGSYFEIIGENPYCLKTITKGMNIIDIGANIGIYTVLAAEKVGKDGVVIAIEPGPENYKHLLQSIKLNNFQNVIPKNIALTDHEGFEKLYLYSSTAHSLISHEDKNSYIKVPVKTIDKLFEELNIKKVDIIKIDAEGAEIPILKGAEKTLKANPNVKLFIASYHYPSESQEVCQFLNERGFKTKVSKENIVIA